MTAIGAVGVVSRAADRWAAFVQRLVLQTPQHFVEIESEWRPPIDENWWRADPALFAALDTCLSIPWAAGGDPS